MFELLKSLIYGNKALLKDSCCFISFFLLLDLKSDPLNDDTIREKRVS